MPLYNNTVIYHVFYTRISWCGCISLDMSLFSPSIMLAMWGFRGFTPEKINAVSEFSAMLEKKQISAMI